MILRIYAVAAPEMLSKVILKSNLKINAPGIVINTLFVIQEMFRFGSNVQRCLIVWRYPEHCLSNIIGNVSKLLGIELKQIEIFFLFECLTGL